MKVIIRRPHAYWFLGDLFKLKGGVKGSNPVGVVLGDGEHVPIPGVYILDASGNCLSFVGLSKGAALEDLLDALAGS